MKSLIFGIVAGTLCTLSFIPQVVKIVVHKQSQGVSLITFSVFSVGMFFWLIYGIMIMSWPVIVTNALTLVLSLLIVAMKLRYR